MYARLWFFSRKTRFHTRFRTRFHTNSTLDSALDSALVWSIRWWYWWWRSWRIKCWNRKWRSCTQWSTSVANEVFFMRYAYGFRWGTFQPPPTGFEIAPSFSTFTIIEINCRKITNAQQKLAKGVGRVLVIVSCRVVSCRVGSGRKLRNPTRRKRQTTIYGISRNLPGDLDRPFP